MKRILMSMAALAAMGAIVSCGGSSHSTHKASGLTFRAFVSNPLLPSGGGFNTPVLNIVDALQDVLSTSTISLLTNSLQPGLMAVSPDLELTMVFSPAGNTLAVINNTTESIATASGSNTTLPSITLPGFTESMFIGNANTAAYAAVPTAPVIGQPPGAVVVVNLQNGSISASIPVPGAHFIVPSVNSNDILVFSDNSNIVTVIATVLIGTHTDPRSYITGFDRPVWGVFSGGSAYILNCGPPCGGINSSVSFVAGLPAPGTTVPFSGIKIPVSAATHALLSGTTLYVTGTPPVMPCGAGTAAKHCGKLSVIDTSSMTVTGSATVTDGYHNRIEMSQDGQLFIGAHSCTNIVVPGGEVRGCLSIFNPSAFSVVVPPQNGDVTGIAPIAGRDVVYVCQNASLAIYDTTTDKLQVTQGNTLNNNGQVDIVGDAVDVKLVD